MRIDLNLLPLLDALLKERSVSAVAERLGVSQPAVSAGLKKLRETFADELFVRVGKGMQPTPKALALGAPVQKMLELVETEMLAPPSFEPATSTRRFVINTTDIGEMVFMPKILHLIGRLAPGISLACTCLGARELRAAMAAGEVDLAIGYLPDLVGNSLYTQGLFEHPFVCIARSDRPVIGELPTLEAYTRAEHVGLVGEGHSQKKFEAIIKRAGIERRIVFRSQHFMNIPFIIRETNLVATLPKVIAVAFAHLPGLRVCKPPFELPAVPIRLYWHQKLHNDPAQIWLRRNICDLFQNKDPTAGVALG